MHQSLGSNAGEVEPFDCVEDASSEQLENSKSGAAPVVAGVEFGGFSNCFEQQGAARGGLTGVENLHLPTYLVTEARRSGKGSNLVKKLAKVSLVRTSSPFANLPKCPILDLGRFEDATQASSGGESKDFQSSLSSVHLLVHQLKQGGLCLASSPTTPSPWQSLVKATDQVRSFVESPGRLSSGRLASKPESSNVAAENEEITDDDSIEVSISDEGNIEEVESGDDDEYTPKKAGLDWWKKKGQLKVKRTKRGGKRKKSYVGDQQSISKYFKKPEVAEIEDDNDDDGEVEEVAEVVEVGKRRSFVGECPLCGQGFADMNQLSTHASNCQDTA